MKTGTVTGFCNMLIEEHRYAENFMEQIDAWFIDSKDLLTLRTVFGSLKLDMNRHFICEEKALFPVLSQYKTMILMAVEHDDIFKARDDFEKELNQSILIQNVTSELYNTWINFKEALQSHIREEEHGIFPMAENLLEPEEKLLVKRKLDETADWAKKNISLDKPVLERHIPTYKIWTENIFQIPPKPIVYEKLFESEHAGVYHLFIEKDRALSYHWAPEHLYLIVISGEITFQTEEEILSLKPGYRVALDPRKYFSIQAVLDSQLVIFKVWPKPHFIKT